MAAIEARIIEIVVMISRKMNMKRVNKDPTSMLRALNDEKSAKPSPSRCMLVMTKPNMYNRPRTKVPVRVIVLRIFFELIEHALLRGD